jgi:hypothetical protein
MLSKVKPGMADMLAVNIEKPLSFDTYYELLSSAAAQYDVGLQHKQKMMIYFHDVDEVSYSDDDVADNSDWSIAYDIDTPVTCLEANMNRQFPHRQLQRPMRTRRTDNFPRKGKVGMP